MKFIVSILFIGFFTIVKSQEFAEDMASLVTKMQGLNNYKLSVKVDVYENFGSKIPIQTVSSSIEKYKDNSFLVMGFNKILVNDEFKLYINEEQQLIYISKLVRRRRNIKIDYSPKEFVKNIKLSMNNADSIHFIQKSDAKEYTIYDAGGLFEITEILIDNNTNFLKQINYYYNKDKVENYSYVEIIYENFNSAPTFSSSYFNESRFLVFSLDKFEGVGEYKNYTIINE